MIGNDSSKPCIAVGNVAQLTVDLLINSIMKEGDGNLVGRISSHYLRPVVGPNAFDLFSKHVTTSCEVYESPKHKVVILQLRSPPYQGMSMKFVSSVADWMKQSAFSKVIALTSSFSQFLAPVNLSEGMSPVRYLSSSSIPGIEPVVKVEPYSHQPSEAGVIRIPGSGFALKLHKACTDNGCDVQLLVKYCSEGDNTPDALHLINVLNTMIKVRPTSDNINWVPPVSWNKLFGDEHPTTLF